MRVGRLSPEEVGRYTPRQAFAILIVNREIDRNEQALALYHTALAAQGSGEHINKELKSLAEK